MTTYGTSSEGEDGTILTKTLGLQSQKVSVNIKARWVPGQKSAEIAVRRTCYTDDLEPWKPYWVQFLQKIKVAGYTIR